MRGVYYLAMHLGNQSRRLWNLPFLALSAFILTWGQILFESYVISHGIPYHAHLVLVLDFVLVSTYLGCAKFHSSYQNYKLEMKVIHKKVFEFEKRLPSHFGRTVHTINTHNPIETEKFHLI